MEDMQRVNIRLSGDVYQWFKTRSEKTGVSMSALMFLALEDHVRQNTIVSSMPEIMEQLRLQQENNKQ
ncbi:hypothetical protein [Metabacillus idriensis]|uniref:hypothetical protein n=1 Tax=Metabacillus idriensis TaxID=324768 RepID=UPI0010F1529E|nr:hypothetical protein [Metabacillus idriensis]VPJ05721.1 Uncharacterised protein [Streptococcus pneumoniae]